MRSAILIVILLLVIIVAGGFVGWYLYNPTCTIRGTITRDGKPLKWKGDDETLVVVFVPTDRNDINRYRAQIADRDAGTFTIEKIPAGSYRVSIQQQFGKGLYDRLGMVYNTEKSPEVREVTHDGQVIDVDLPKDLPRKNG